MSIGFMIGAFENPLVSLRLFRKPSEPSNPRMKQHETAPAASQASRATDVVGANRALGADVFDARTKVAGAGRCDAGEFSLPQARRATSIDTSGQTAEGQPDNEEESTTGSLEPTRVGAEPVEYVERSPEVIEENDRDKILDMELQHPEDDELDDVHDVHCSFPIFGYLVLMAFDRILVVVKIGFDVTPAHPAPMSI
ncbi:hypothetical protein BDZ89DRAFT_1222942 [Hymenopellis radicata]|nr:hypothetical protein BDZ89DRAFT_1222942 [Hymenopellis radicata]